MQGTVKKYLCDRGFGFLKSDDADSPDRFFHIRSFADKNAREPVAGDRVEYDISSDKTGREQAVNLRLIEA